MCVFRRGAGGHQELEIVDNKLKVPCRCGAYFVRLVDMLLAGSSTRWLD